MVKFYNAGAGSGKTFQLSKDLSDFLINKNGKPSEVILTTFSIKSAEELKERVRKDLVDKGEPEKATEISNALIGTVNAVCSQLVEKYAMEIGLSPELKVLDEESSKLLFNECVAESVSEENYIELNRLCNLFSIYERKENGFFKDELKPDWPGIVKNMSSRFRAYNFQEEEIEQSKAEAIRIAKEFLITKKDFSVNEIWEEISKVKGKDLEGKTAKEDRKILDALKSLNDLYNRKEQVKWSHFSNAGGETGKTAPGNNPWFADVVSKCGDYMLTEEFANGYLELIKLLYDTAFDLIENYQQFKKERGLIDFADQELLFLQMIRENEVVKKEIAATFKLIMVDEFQDSSPVQLSIFTTLKSMVSQSIWVGDPKQAIYGFRDSDIELFHSALESVKEEEGNSIDVLKYSYRSRPGIVSAVNEIFKGIFKGKLEDEYVTLHPSEQVLVNEKNRDGFVSPSIIIQFYGGSNADSLYSSIAIYIKELLQSDTQVYDKNSECFRRIRGGDIALLFRTGLNIKAAAEKFKEEDIEISCEAEGFQQQAEIVWISCLLRLLVSDKDSLAIGNLAILENAIGSVEELLEKKLEYPAPTLDNNWEDNWKDISPVVKNLLCHKNLLTQLSLFKLISQLVNLTQLPRYCVQWGNGGQRMANLNKLIQISLSYEESCIALGLAATITGFIDHLSQNEELPPSESEDAVTLMTVHKSKGLEWPMVIPVNLALTDDDSKVLFNRVHVLQTKKPDISNLLKGQRIIYLPWPFSSSKRIATVAVQDKLVQKLQENKVKLEEELHAFSKNYEEEDRLLYVALTRARDFLVLAFFKKESSCHVENGNRSNPTGLFTEEHWQELKNMADETTREIEFKGHKILLSKMPELVDVAATQSPERTDVSFYSNVERYNGEIYGKRFINPSSSKVNMKGIKIEVLDFNQPRLPLYKTKSDIDDIIGTAIHNVIASWKMEKSKDDRIILIQNLLVRMGLESHLKANELDSQVENFWSYILKKYSPVEIDRELPLIQIERDNGTVTSGIADMVLYTKNGIVLIDHKTYPGDFKNIVQDPANEKYAGKYAAQLNSYKQMLEESTGETVIATILNYVVQGKLVEVKTEIV